MARVTISLLLLAILAGSALAASYSKYPPSKGGYSPSYSPPKYEDKTVSVFKFIAKTVKNKTSIDMVDPMEKGPGDRSFYQFDILDTYVYKKIGYLAGVNTLLLGTNEYADMTAVVPYGSIQIAGLADWTLTNNKLSAVGGTGKYAGSSGYVDLKTLFAVPNSFNFTFQMTFYLYLY